MTSDYTHSQLDELLALARRIAEEVARPLANLDGAIGPVRSKSTLRDWVTDWDTRCEDAIRERLAAACPEIPVFGEERGGTRAAPQRWLIDPIDGTVNFAHGIPFFAVVIALEVEAQPVVGVIRAPALGWEFYGRAGSGAFLNQQPLEVSRTRDLASAMLSTGFPYSRATDKYANFEEWEHMQRTAGACRRFGAASLDLAMVARGWLDGYWESRLNPWDVAAGALLVREAGGTVTDIDGSPFLASTGNVVASNGPIHQAIVTELANARPDRCTPESSPSR